MDVDFKTLGKRNRFWGMQYLDASIGPALPSPPSWTQTFCSWAAHPWWGHRCPGRGSNTCQSSCQMRSQENRRLKVTNWFAVLLLILKYFTTVCFAHIYSRLPWCSTQTPWKVTTLLLSFNRRITTKKCFLSTKFKYARASVNFNPSLNIFPDFLYLR